MERSRGVQRKERSKRGLDRSLIVIHGCKLRALERMKKEDLLVQSYIWDTELKKEWEPVRSFLMICATCE